VILSETKANRHAAAVNGEAFAHEVGDISDYSRCAHGAMCDMAAFSKTVWWGASVAMVWRGFLAGNVIKQETHQGSVKITRNLKTKKPPGIA
jgi:hypothetical protein